MLGDKHTEWTKEAQEVLFIQNHPYDCSNSDILLCSTRVNKFQGTGSRLFFLGRCLTEALNTGRAVVLSEELMSTHEMLRPFKPWGNCSIQDIKLNMKISRTKRYFPMDAPSLTKSSEMPAVGALYPRRYSERGYWWWKAQEITYALRPMRETLQAFHSKFENKLGNMIAFQIRRTDKTQGCAEIYGMF